jgi:hypothetical protein
MLATSTQFRRVKGYRKLPQLAQALRHAVATPDPSTVAVTAWPYDPSEAATRFHGERSSSLGVRR